MADRSVDQVLASIDACLADHAYQQAVRPLLRAVGDLPLTTASEAWQAMIGRDGHG